MHRTVIQDPKDTTGLVVGWSRHHLFDQAIKGRDAIDGLAPAEDSGVVDIQSTEINPSPTTFISILDATSDPVYRVRWDGYGAGLNARLLISTDDEFIGFQRFIVPLAAI
jgi:hypothetical protein